MFFIDESGSIPKDYNGDPKLKYFVISFVHIDDTRKLKSVYKRSIRNLKKHYPDFFNALPNPNECKASEMLPFMKDYIISNLVKINDFKICYMVVNNEDLEDRFRKNSSRSFNYLVKLMIENCVLSKSEKEDLKLILDNRNVKLKGLNELQGYLFNNFVLDDNIIQAVSVDYVDSQHHTTIQIADLIANVVFQKFKYQHYDSPNINELKTQNLILPETSKYLFDLLEPSMELALKFPPNTIVDKMVASSKQ